MTEPQTIESADAHREAQPNEPQWVFDGSVPQHDRDRYQEDLTAALKTVFDPEIPCDIYELGLIYTVEVCENREVKVNMTLTAPGCPVAGEMGGWVETAVASVPGVMASKANIVFDPAWDQGRMSDEARVALDMF